MRSSVPCTLFLLLALSTALCGQTLSRITPEAASPGDLVILTGMNLQNVTMVRFFASVGGFVGVWTVNVVPLSTSPTRVAAIVPAMAAFAPPNATPPGSPVGTVSAISPLAPALASPVDRRFARRAQSALLAKQPPCRH